MSERRIGRQSPQLETPRPTAYAGPVAIEGTLDPTLPKPGPRKPRAVAQPIQSQEQAQLEATRQALRAQGLPTIAAATGGDPVYVSPLLEEVGAVSAMKALQELNPEEYIIAADGHYRADARRGGKNGDRFGHIITGKEYETYTIDNPDGTQTVYSQRVPATAFTRIPLEEQGVWEETYSAPKGHFKMESSRKPLERKRVGAESEMVKVMGADGREREVFVVYTDKFEAHKKEIREKRENEIQQAMAKTTYIPTERDAVLQSAHKQQLKTLLATSKETAREQLVHTSKLIAVNGASSLVYWVPNILPVLGPAGAIPRMIFSISGGILGNNLLNKAYNANPTTTRTMNYAAAVGLGYGVGTIIAPPLGLVGLGTGLIGVGVSLAAIAGSEFLRDKRGLRNFAKNHPEITDKAQLKQMYRSEKSKALFDQQQENKVQMRYMQESKMQAQRMKVRQRGLESRIRYPENFLETHQATVDQLQKQLPNMTERELAGAVDELHYQHNASENLAGYYLKKAAKGFVPRAYGGLFGSILLLSEGPQLPLIGLAVKLAFKKYPYIFSLIFTTWGSLINPLWTRRNVNKAREEMRQNHPELLKELGNGNGKKK